VAPSKKYESEGGLGLHHLFGVLRGTFMDRPIVAANAVVQWIAFNYLTGNLDAHAKTLAFLMRGHKAAVAPFYDMLCVEAYPREVIEHALAHQLKDKAEASYARGTLFDKRRRLMADWAKHCSTVANVASVTPINSKNAAA